jgi:hypothetical protein
MELSTQELETVVFFNCISESCKKESSEEENSFPVLEEK